VYIKGTDHTIIIQKNTFNLNTAVKGLVYLDLTARTNPVLLAENTFTYNAAFIDASAFYIRAQPTVGVSVLSISPAAETDLQCGGYYFYSNSYSYNAGCAGWESGVLQFECVESTATIYSNDYAVFSTPPSD
jgi:hypothetical protein